MRESSLAYHRPELELESQGLLIQPPFALFAHAEYCVALMAAQARNKNCQCLLGAKLLYVLYRQPVPGATNIDRT